MREKLWNNRLNNWIPATGINNKSAHIFMVLFSNGDGVLLTLTIEVNFAQKMIATYLLARNWISYHLLHLGMRLSYRVIAAPETFRDITNWLVLPKLLNKQINLAMNLNGNKSLFILNFVFIYSSPNGINRIRREQEVLTFVELKKAKFKRNRNSNDNGFAWHENTIWTSF